MSLSETRIDRTTTDFVYGATRHRLHADAPWGAFVPFMKAAQTPWFLGSAHDILTKIGISTTARRATEFSQLFDGLDGFYYVAMATPGTGPDRSDIALKWILGYISETFRTRGFSFEYLSLRLPADALRTFLDALESGRCERKFSKEILDAILDAPSTDPTRSGADLVAAILARPAYVALRDTDVYVLVDQVVAANPDQVERAKANPKILQWLVGQVLKASGGKAAPGVIMVALRTALDLPER